MKAAPTQTGEKSMTSSAVVSAVVTVGQVWKDLDKRMTNRHGKVVSIRGAKAVMSPCTEHGRVINAREIKVALARMNGKGSGWALVPEAD